MHKIYRLSFALYLLSSSIFAWAAQVAPPPALAVKAYLLSKDVTPTRLTATGFGETKPISTNDTEVGRSQNRRVELELVIR